MSQKLEVTVTTETTVTVKMDGAYRDRLNNALDNVLNLISVTEPQRRAALVNRGGVDTLVALRAALENAEE